MIKQAPKWVVKQCCPQELTWARKTSYEIRYLKFSRHVIDRYVAQFKGFSNVGLLLQPIVDCIVGETGGYLNLGFVWNDLYNSMKKK